MENQEERLQLLLALRRKGRNQPRTVEEEEVALLQDFGRRGRPGRA
jgi:septum formation topological specificity factor MinE